MSEEAMSLEDAIIATALDPLAFVRLVWPWGEVGHALEKHEGPDTWQAETLILIRDELAKRVGDPLATALQIAVASGHGIGKSCLIAWIIYWFMCTRHNPQLKVTANTKDQLLGKTWRELAKWHKLALNKSWFTWTATRFFLSASPETWFAEAVTWSKERSEAFAGTHEEFVMVIYDEASLIDDSIWEVTEGVMTTPGAMWIAFGNPTRNTGRFRECFGRFKHRWLTRQIDSRTAKMANQQQIGQWVEDYGEDSDFVRIRVRGVFPRAGATQFIAVDIVEEAQRREVDVPHGAPRLLGVDVARYGDDQTVLARLHGRKLEPLEKYRGLDTMQTAAVVANVMRTERPDTVFVDGTGLGAGVVDRLRQLGHDVVEVHGGASPDEPNKAIYYNKRIEMWGRMRDWLKGADIPDDNELYMDLIGPEYAFDAKMRQQLEKKEDMKGRGLSSPDCADAVALCFAYVTPPRQDVTSADMEPEPEEAY